MKDNEIMVSMEDKHTLSNHLTIVFLPVVYIIVFVVGLPANALAKLPQKGGKRKIATMKDNEIMVSMEDKHTLSNHLTIVFLPVVYIIVFVVDLIFVIWVSLKIAYHFNNNDWI
ncbi:hypothetical protein WMY93_031884 [Mugilogobius chulae]|uniref:Uncharacterized protein n=1 Tax=Mugilogobius chulae TaxID=88201 RepID=A0AAW0MJZ3_9GOBI